MLYNRGYTALIKNKAKKSKVIVTYPGSQILTAISPQRISILNIKGLLLDLLN